jgi:Glycosyltransferase
MKILLVNTFETKGGAAVACKRLAVALEKEGLDVHMLVEEKTTADRLVISLKESPLSRIRFAYERFIIFLNNRLDRENLFKVSIANTGRDITKLAEFKEADIIHLHWINQGMLSLRDLEKITKSGKTIIWTMHDMWPITGICHHSGICSNYEKDCGNCHLLHAPSPKDLSFRVLRKKKKILPNSGIQFVACSQWLMHKAESSSLKKGNYISSISNPIDTEAFRPGDQKLARTELGLPTDKKLILFGAYSISDKLKGIDYLIEATQLLKDLKEEMELVFIGEEKEELSANFGLKAHFMGYISDTKKLITLYQSIDCYVTPSLQENLPNMIMEAMSCGVPCVGFHTGGIPEMIAHDKTGYVAQYKSSEDLAKGIRLVLKKSSDKAFKQANRDYVLSNYSEKAVARRYIELYEKNLTRRSK